MGLCLELRAVVRPGRLSHLSAERPAPRPPRNLGGALQRGLLGVGGFPMLPFRERAGSLRFTAHHPLLSGLACSY